MAITAVDGRVFAVRRELIDVTSLSRADEGWTYIDPAGHAHQWEWPDGRRVYQPGKAATVPTVEWVRTGVGYYEDGEAYDLGQYECLRCHAVITPRTKADDHSTYVAGLAHCEIDGLSVSRDVFELEARSAGLDI